MRAVTPAVVKYSWGTFSPTWDSMTFIGQAPLMYSWPETYGCKVRLLPDFHPNDYLLEKHKDKGKEPWEIFAWAVRDIMAKVGGFEKNEQHLSDKMLYKQFMAGHFDEFELNGKTIRAEPFKRKQPLKYSESKYAPSKQKAD